MSQSSTSVPAPALTDAGFQAPPLADILAGTISDLQAAFSGRLSFYDANGNLETSRPQSQIAISEAAIISDMHAAFLAIMAGVDPQTSSGVMQDAIGRIYFMERRAGTPTIVTGVCRGAQGTVIPAGTIVQDTGGQTYTANETGVIGPDGTVSIEFSNSQTGPIPCPEGTLTQLYQIISGWDSITNPVAGAIGQNVESRTDFEARRQASVAANSIGQNASLMGALLALPGVTDAFVTDNPSQTDMTQQGVTIPAGAQYILVEGGNPTDIGRAILNKKPPGIATVGTHIVTVQDTNPVYAGNQPSYSFHYDRPTPVAVYVTMEIAASDTVPNNAAQLIQQAIMSYLTTGTTRIRIGKTLYASRLSAVVDGLGDWAEVLTLSIGTDANAGQNRLTLPINQLPTVTADTISVQVVT